MNEPIYYKIRPNGETVVYTLKETTTRGIYEPVVHGKPRSERDMRKTLSKITKKNVTGYEAEPIDAIGGVSIWIVTKLEYQQ